MPSWRVDKVRTYSLPRLRELRLERKISQQELQFDLGYCREHISRIEMGRHTPKLKTIVDIADYFNVSVDYLIGRSDKRDR